MVIKLGKRGRTFLEYSKYKVWETKEEILRRRRGHEVFLYLLENPNRISATFSELECIAQSRLRDQGIHYFVSLPSGLVYRIGNQKAPHVNLLFKRLRHLHPALSVAELKRRAVSLRLEGAYCVVT